MTRRAPKTATDDDAPSKAARKFVPKEAADPAAPAKAASKAASTSLPKKSTSPSAPPKPLLARAPKSSAIAPVSTKAPSPQAAKKAAAQAAKKPVNDRSLESALKDREAMEALAGRSLESLVAEFAPKDRRLDNIDAIVSPRITDPTARVVKGATVRKCAQCSEDVWVAPSTFAAFKGRTMPPIWCAECAMIIAELNSPLRKGRPAGRA